MVGINDVESRRGRCEEIPHDHLFRVTGLSSENLPKLAKEISSQSSNFETAIAATGYGKFNAVLMLCCLPAFWSAISVPSSVSYIFARARCDMELSLVDMGTANAITYGGMISSAMIWGFLSDTLGRKQIMVYGFLISGFMDLMAAASQNYAMLLVTRFMSGFFFNGPFAVLLSYIAELHSKELRAKVMLLSSLFYTIGNSTLPLVAWAVLTQDINFEFFNGRIVIHSWNIFLFITSLGPFISGVAFVFLPESPKFLMSRGRNDEAIKVFQSMFAMNTGKTEKAFPIQYLVEEKPEKQAVGVAALRGGFRQLAPLFKPPHGAWLLLMCIIHTGLMFGSNTLRLWFPQLAAMIGASEGEGLCAAIEPVAEIIIEETEGCQPILTDLSTYLQSCVVGAGSVLTYGIGGAIINICGKRLVSATCGVLSALMALLLPFFGFGSISVVAMVGLSLAFTSLFSASLSSVMVDLFPTDLRVMALAMFLMLGRLGTIVGTVTFPALINFGCIPPFLTIALVLAACGLACFILPNTTLKNME